MVDHLVLRKPTRNPQLDVLRAVAVVMVLICHSTYFHQPTWDLLLWRPAWSGVDLFFVISGFLISGLLFSEYRKTRKIHFARFFIRRAFKLYPAFYALVLLTAVPQLLSVHGNSASNWRPLFNDVFFFQAYREGSWGHFWSLSVEEHFYLLLPLVLWTVMRFQKGSANPFRWIPVAVPVIAIATLTARLLTAAYVRPFRMQTHLFPTHLRMDSLLFGVLLGYCFHFHREGFSQFVMRHLRLILCAGFILLTPLLFIGQYDQWMYTYGFTSTYLGYGCLLIAFLHVELGSGNGFVTALIRGVSYVGTFSYSIYLWHVPWLTLVRALPLENTAARLGCFYGGSILLGILAGEVIEAPALRLRETLFPRQAQIEIASLQDKRVKNNIIADIRIPADLIA